MELADELNIAATATANASDNYDDHSVTSLLWTPEQNLAVGDSALVDEQYEAAIVAYTRALSALEPTTAAAAAIPFTTSTTISEGETENAAADTTLPLQFRVLSHRSAALLRLDRFAEAHTDAWAAKNLLQTSRCTAGFRSGETILNWKRLGMACYSLHQHKDALDAFREAHQLAELKQRPSTTNASSGSTNQVSHTASIMDSNNNENNTSFFLEWMDRCRMHISSSSSPDQPVTKINPTTSKAPPTASRTGSAQQQPAGPSSNAETTVPKYQYYQSDKFMTIAILESNVPAADLTTEFATHAVTVRLKKAGTDHTVVAGTVCEAIVPEECRVAIRDDKVLIKLRKATANTEWQTLLSTKKPKQSTTATTSTVANGKGETAAVDGSEVLAGAATGTIAAATSNIHAEPAAPKARPYASQKNWDSIAKDIAELEEAEKPAGDDAMNKLFQSIYAGADEDTKRAMIKSYQTSGGTVLSTNWKEVKEKDYENERVAPKGQEWKNWEGDKLPMKEDD